MEEFIGIGLGLIKTSHVAVRQFSDTGIDSIQIGRIGARFSSFVNLYLQFNKYYHEDIAYSVSIGRLLYNHYL